MPKASTYRYRYTNVFGQRVKRFSKHSGNYNMIGLLMTSLTTWRRISWNHHANLFLDNTTNAYSEGPYDEHWNRLSCRYPQQPQPSSRHRLSIPLNRTRTILWDITLCSLRITSQKIVLFNCVKLCHKYSMRGTTETKTISNDMYWKSGLRFTVQDTSYFLPGITER
jgi:hypothetical protein